MQSRCHYHGFKSSWCHPNGVWNHGVDSSLLGAQSAAGPQKWLEEQPSFPQWRPRSSPSGWTALPHYADDLPLVLGVSVGKYIKWLCLVAVWPVGCSTRWVGRWCRLSHWLPSWPPWHQGTASALSVWKPVLASFPEHLSSLGEEHWTAADYYFQASSMVFCTIYNEINSNLFFSR